MSEHEPYMDQCLAQGRISLGLGALPTASVIVRDGAVIGRGHNTVATDLDPSAHAEVAAIREACRRVGATALPGTTIYTSMEPCPMCFWAIQEAGIPRLVLGGRFAQLGRDDLGRYSIESALEFFGRRLELVTGVRERECLELRRAWMTRHGRGRFA